MSGISHFYYSQLLSILVDPYMIDLKIALKTIKNKFVVVINFGSLNVTFTAFDFMLGKV